MQENLQGVYPKTGEPGQTELRLQRQHQHRLQRQHQLRLQLRLQLQLQLCRPD